MADTDLPIEVAEDPNYPRSKPIEQVSGQPTGAITGIKSVSPFRAAALADKYPDGTPKGPSIWERLNSNEPDAATKISTGVQGLWDRITNNPQSVWERAARGANKAIAAGDVASTTGDAGRDVLPGPDGGEAAPLNTDPATTTTLSADTAAGKPVEKVSDVWDRQNPALPLMPPNGSLVDKIVQDDKAHNEARTGGGGVATPPKPITPETTTELEPRARTLPEEKNPAGLFGVPGLLGKFGENVHNWTDQRRMQLLALAGGLAGAPSLGVGFGRGFTAAANTMPAQQAFNAQNATADYFQKHGMDRNLALAMAGNKAMAQEAIGQMTGVNPPKTMQTKDWLGGQHNLQWDMKNKRWQPIDDEGNTISVGGGGGAAAAGIPGGLTRNVTPEEWQAMPVMDRIELIKDPNTKGLVKSLAVGGNMPGRQQMTAANAIMAQIDPDWNLANSYDNNHKMAQELMKVSPQSQGGSLLRAMSTYEHFKDAAKASADVGGWSGWNGPGGTLAGNIYQGGRNTLADPRLGGLLTQEKKQWGNASNETTSYYAGAPGGEGERTAGQLDVSKYKTPMEKAGALRGQAEQIAAKLKIHMGMVMGTHAGRQYFKDRPEILQTYQKNLHELDVQLARLDPTGPEAQRLRGAGQTPPQSTGSTMGAVPPGWSVKQISP